MRTLSGSSALERRLIGVAAAIFVFLPVATVIGGLRARPLENRPLAKPPSLNAGWDVFTQASSYVSDHLPVRAAAVGANQSVVAGVFREPPPIPTSISNGVAYPRVVIGSDDWLFYGQDFELPCAPVEPATATAARLSRLARVLRASGRDVVVTVVPDKSSIATDRLPGRYIGRTCATERKAAFWAAFEADSQPDLVDLRPALRQAQSKPGGAYLRTGTHWTELGSVTYARQIVDHLAPGLWDPSAVKVLGTFTQRSDLGPIIQRPMVDVVPRYSIVRPGVVPRGTLDMRKPRPLTNSVTTPAAFVPGSTVVVGDSFTTNSQKAWRPWFASATFYHRDRDRAATLRAMTSAESVVFEVVERYATQGTLGRVIDDLFIDDLEAALSATP